MRRIPSIASERGAVLIQTALAALVLLGLGTFVVDYGVLWVARHQAQNAADAGATAGAIARAYDDFDDPPKAGGVSEQSALQVASMNLVWGASSPPVTSFACPPEVGAPRRCVRTDVYRNGQHESNPLPRWFAPLLGIATHGVKATASAQVLIPNATNCLRPWAIPDRWTELSIPPDPSFRKYADGTGMELPAPHDEYNPPTSNGPGTGLAFATSNADPGDLGLSVPLTFDDLTNPINPIFRSSVVALQLAGGYAASVAACNGVPIAVGNQIVISAVAPQATDSHGLWAQDAGASWNAVGKTIDGSCAPVCAKVSPRLVAIAVFDVDLFQFRRAKADWAACPPGSASCVPCPAGAPCVSVVNIVGFFVADGTGTRGYLTSYPGLIPDLTKPPVLTAQSSFLKATTLVR